MIGEKLQAMRDRMDNQFIDSVEEADEEMKLDDKPEGDSHFLEMYYYTLSKIYKIEKIHGEEFCLKKVESIYKKAIIETYCNKKGSIDYNTNFVVAHACKDYLDGEA